MSKTGQTERVERVASNPSRVNRLRRWAGKQRVKENARHLRRARFVGRLAIRLLAVALCLLLWEFASRGNWVLLGMRFENVPAPSEVFDAGKELAQSPKVVAHIRSSLARVFAGFGIAAVLAVLAGLAIGRFRLAADTLLPPLEVLRPIPAVAWIPLAILLWPTAESSMIFITFIGAFFPVLLATVHGVECVDRKLIQASRTLGAREAAIFREVIFPGALPAIVTGLSIGMGTSWFSLITAEMVSGQFGIGYFTWEAYTLQNYPAIVLGMAIIGVLGMASSAAITWFGRRLTPWTRFGEQHA
jgi:NitT/TauT family transport system permease protein